MMMTAFVGFTLSRVPIFYRKYHGCSTCATKVYSLARRRCSTYAAAVFRIARRIHFAFTQYSLHPRNKHKCQSGRAICNRKCSVRNLNAKTINASFIIADRRWRGAKSHQCNFAYGTVNFVGRPLWLPHLYLVDSVFHFLVSSVRCFTFFSSLSVDAFRRPVICRFGYLCVYGVDLRVSRFYVYFSFTRYGLTFSCNLWEPLKIPEDIE